MEPGQLRPHPQAALALLGHQAGVILVQHRCLLSRSFGAPSRRPRHAVVPRPPRGLSSHRPTSRGGGRCRRRRRRGRALEERAVGADDEEALDALTGHVARSAITGERVERPAAGHQLRLRATGDGVERGAVDAGPRRPARGHRGRRPGHRARTGARGGTGGVVREAVERAAPGVDEHVAESRGPHGDGRARRVRACGAARSRGLGRGAATASAGGEERGAGECETGDGSDLHDVLQGGSGSSAVRAAAPPRFGWHGSRDPS